MLRICSLNFARSSLPIAVLSLLTTACPDSGDTSGASASETSTSTATATAPTTGNVNPTSTTQSTDDPTGGTSTVGTEGTGPTTTEGTSTTQGVDTTTSDTTTTSTTEPETSTSTTEDTTSTTTTSTTTTTGETTETTGEPASDIEIVITADNAYGFAYGTDDNISMYWGGIENTTAGEIFNCGEGPEKYVVPYEEADNASYLYIIAWADSSTTQGVLARFRRKDGGGNFGEDVFTGTDGWEVCATGVDYQPGSGGPSLQVINDHIGKCNAGALDPNTTSVGWVDDVGTPYGAVAFGEDNTTPYNGGPMAGNEFPLVCPMDMPPEAKWMWFNWDPPNVKPPQSPFMWPGGGGNPDHQYLIFRFAAELVPIPM
ncbi:hypothetical protein [Nannocystis punicea]|uniref:Uncharacterized protein n=1 Tax=Nannocystis punicea TaxID=2995304 RepID=A0ABY7GS98_9BACT|nr:hypothetical protein [Nannocystis poenicansa]WAS89831.1 hypothetical protein O0S08_26870 [Nannocystis poenicansa]